MGFYEFSKYFKNQKKLGEKIEELVSPRAVIEDLTPSPSIEEEAELKLEEVPEKEEDFQEFVLVHPEEQEETYKPEEDEPPEEKITDVEEESKEDADEQFTSDTDTTEDDDSYSSY